MSNKLHSFALSTVWRCRCIPNGPRFLRTGKLNLHFALVFSAVYLLTNSTVAKWLELPLGSTKGCRFEILTMAISAWSLHVLPLCGFSLDTPVCFPGSGGKVGLVAWRRALHLIVCFYLCNKTKQKELHICSWVPQQFVYSSLRRFSSDSVIQLGLSAKVSHNWSVKKKAMSFTLPAAM